MKKWNTKNPVAQILKLDSFWGGYGPFLYTFAFQKNAFQGHKFLYLFKRDAIYIDGKW